MKISVVMAVYNAHNFLSDAIESVLSQSVREIELICVNDGSTDDSLDILRRYAEIDDRIQVFTHENHGASYTRNVALSNATGEYIHILDGDDIAPAGAYERMYTLAKKDDLDMLLFDAQVLYDTPSLAEQHEDLTAYYKRNKEYGGVRTGEELFCALSADDAYRSQASMYLMKREYQQSKNIIFYEGITHEDQLYTFLALIQAPRTSHVNEPLFTRRIRENSVMTEVVKFGNVEGLLTCFTEMFLYAIDNITDESVKNAAISEIAKVAKSGIWKYTLLSAKEQWNGKTGSTLPVRTLIRSFGDPYNDRVKQKQTAPSAGAAASDASATAQKKDNNRKTDDKDSQSKDAQPQKSVTRSGTGTGFRTRIKRIFGRFWPVPSRTFHSRMYALEDRHNKDMSAITAAMMDISGSLGTLRSAVDNLQKATDGINKVVTEVLWKRASDTQQLASDTQRLAYETRKTVGDIQKVSGESQRMIGESQRMIGESQSTIGETQRTAGEIVNKVNDAIRITGETNYAASMTRKTADEIKKETAEMYNIISGVLWKRASETQQLVSDTKKTAGEIHEISKNIEKTTNGIASDGGKLHQNTRNTIVNAVTKTWRRDIIEHLDFQLVNHCNLNCKGCSTFSPIASQKFADPEEFRRDLSRLHMLIGDGIQQIHLLGGEPLLHPQAESFAIICRSVFTMARIDFTTNGLLTGTMQPEFWDVLREQNVDIKYTRYPIDFDYDEMVEFIRSKGLFVFSAGNEIKHFRRIPLNTKGTFNIYKSYSLCPYTDCPQLRGGRLYRCPASALIDIVNEEMEATSQIGRFRLDAGDYLDIYQASRQEDVYEFLSRPIPFCQYCDMEHMDPLVTWSMSNRDIREWVDL